MIWHDHVSAFKFGPVLLQRQLSERLPVHASDFLYWAPHIVHTPLQVPGEFFDRFDFMEETDLPTHERQTYHAMVAFADEAILNFTEAVKTRNMWDNMLIIFSSGGWCRDICILVYVSICVCRIYVYICIYMCIYVIYIHPPVVCSLTDLWRVQIMAVPSTLVARVVRTTIP